MKLSELKPGDWIMLNDNGVEREGTVLRVSNEDHKVCVNNGVQEFWYELEYIKPLPLSEEQLLNLGFEKLESDAGGVKYGKRAFRVHVPSETDFSKVEAWYREDNRFFDHPINVHHLQNIHLDMTKMPLEA
ncbi:hypothetical protein [Niabella ginsengisoli]|uniref:Uncharacterized protein n=1 Tax=Niabella ginsengisoli TaxID=522298 RepID=A0ABS9SDV5_9BACT|nr:hypothetical protein [Niabella ginsengisoli]MCH5596534.1 hypothetical protein [Niabella ginsengisoli]